MLVKFNQVADKIITIRNQKVIIDSDVAELYGVETKRINEAVKNNQDKNFQQDILLSLTIKNLRICGRKFRPQTYQKLEFYPKLLPKKVCICLPLF